MGYLVRLHRPRFLGFRDHVDLGGVCGARKWGEEICALMLWYDGLVDQGGMVVVDEEISR